MKLEWIERLVSFGCNGCVLFALGNVIAQLSGNGHFHLRIFAQADANSVADAVGQQSANTHCRFDTSVFTVTGFGNAQMQGKIHAFFFHFLNEQSHGLYHHQSVGRFDRNHHVVELFLDADAQIFHTGSHHALRRVAMAFHHAGRKRTMVHTDADSGLMFFAKIKKGNETGTDGGLHIVFALYAGRHGIGKVARIDAYFFHMTGGCFGGFGIEVNIGHQRRGVSFFAQSLTDISQIFCFFHALGCETDQITARFDNGLRLGNASLGVEGGSVGHRLQTNRIRSAQKQRADFYFSALTLLIMEIIFAIRHNVTLCIRNEQLVILRRL